MPPQKRNNIYIMGISKNRVTPKSSISIGFSIIFTIRFGVFYPYFWVDTHIWRQSSSHQLGTFFNPGIFVVNAPVSPSKARRFGRTVGTNCLQVDVQHSNVESENYIILTHDNSATQKNSHLAGFLGCFSQKEGKSTWCFNGCFMFFLAIGIC